MSRSISQIQNAIIAQVQSDPTLGPLLTSPSSTALWKLWTFIVATSQGTEEQLYDQFMTEIEALLSTGAPMTASWIQNQVFNFQYSTSVPQIIQLSTTTFAPYWPIVDSSLRIITRCSVTRGILSQVAVKVAKGTTPTALNSTELNALQSFLNTIGAAGIIYNAISLNPDKLSTKVTVYYKGVYSSVIQANLLAAYNNLLTNIPFDGTIKVSDIETAMLNVNGVNDVVVNEVSARPDTISFGSGTTLVTGNTELLKEWQTVAGYLVDESTSGFDFLSRLVLISQ